MQQPRYLAQWLLASLLSLACGPLLAGERPVYRCGDSYQDSPCAGGDSQPLAIDKPPSTPTAIRPLPDLVPTPTSPPRPTAAAVEPPPPCNPPSAAQQALIERATRFWRVVPCMTAEEALRIIGDAPMAKFDLGGSEGDELIELVIEPQPRLPNRVFIRRGYVVETVGGGELP